MKTTFYKRIIPLAMIASLAMSGASVYAEAAPQTAEAEVEVTEAVDVEEDEDVLEAVLEDDYFVSEGEETEDTTEAPATTEAPTTTEKIEKNPVIAADAKNAIAVNPFDVFDVDDSTTTATLTFTYTKSQLGELDPTKVAITSKSKAAVKGVNIAKVSDAEDAANDVTVVHNDEDGSGTITVKVEIAKKVNATKLYLCYDKKVVSTTAAEYKPSETYDTHNSVVTSGELSYTGIGVDLDYTKVTGGVGATKIAENGFKGKESIKTINFGGNSLTAMGANAFEGCKNLRKVVIPTATNGFTTFGSKAFKDCTSLSVVDMSAMSANFTIPADAFEGCTQNIVVLYGGSNCTMTNQPSNVTIVDTTSSKTDKAYSIVASTADEDVIQIEPNSGFVLKGNEIIGKLAYPESGKADVDLTSIKWSVKGGTAKFAKVDKEGQLALKKTTVDEKEVYSKQFTAASVSGTENIYISGTKSGGKVNKTITVEGTYKDASKKNAVYGTFTLYVNPAPVSEFKDVKLADNSSKKTFKVTKKTAAENTPETQELANAPFAEYDVEMWEGATYAPAVAAKNGDDKTIVYEVDASSKAGAIKVVNGKITALAAGTAVVYAKPLNGDAYVKFNVTVNSCLKKIRANTTSLALVPGATVAQEVTISSATSTANGSTVYKVSAPSSVNVTTNGTENNGDVTVANGVLKLSVSLDADKTVSKSDKIEVTTADGGKVTIKLSQKSAPENVKKFTEKTKLDKATGTRIVNVPVGGTANLNLSISPATAPSGFEWYVEGGTALADNATVDIIGDVVVAKAVGTVNVYAKSTGLASNCAPIESGVYAINVYDPATPIVLPYTGDVTSDDEVVVKGGFLMTAKDADTATSKKVVGGKTYTIDVPDFGEGTVWTVSNPAGAFVDVNGTTMSITVLAKGTYTITGTSAITKQKYSFKVTADALETSAPTGVKLYSKTSGAAGAYAEVTDSSEVDLAVGTKLQLAVNAEGACYDKTAGNITFASSDAAVAAVNAKGLVTVKKAGTAKITATVGSEKVEYTINAKAAASAVKLTVPAYGAKGASVNLAAKGISVRKWYSIDASGTVAELAADGKKFKLPAEAGTYTIVAATTDDAPTAETAEYVSTINVYDVVATKVTALDPHQTWTTAGTPVEATEKLGSLKDLSNAKLGIEAGKNIVIPINATGLQAVDEEGKVKKTVTASKGDITWESSNVNLAYVEKTTTEDEYPYANAYVVIADTGYTGKVTLTGTLNNSGKKVKITLNVVAKKAAADDKTESND